MVLLSVDTSSAQGSLALHKDNLLLGEKSWSKKSTHSELLTSSFIELLKETQISIKDISHLAVGVGPGSFTGIRVGVNFARSLAYARDLKVFVSDSITIAAHSISREERKMLVLMPAFRNFLYYGFFEPRPESWICIEGPGVLTNDEIKNEKFKDSLIVTDTYPWARALGEMASQPKNLSKFGSWREVTPLYIRRSEAEEKFGVCL